MVADNVPDIVLTLALSNGHYRSELRVPMDEVNATVGDRVADWLEMQMRYLEVQRTGESVTVRTSLGASIG